MWGTAPYALFLLYVRFPQIRIFRREFLERIYTAAAQTTVVMRVKTPISHLYYNGYRRLAAARKPDAREMDAAL
jgi:hypothetical protein